MQLKLSVNKLDTATDVMDIKLVFTKWLNLFRNVEIDCSLCSPKIQIQKLVMPLDFRKLINK